MQKYLRVNFCSSITALKIWRYHCQMLVGDVFIPVSYSSLLLCFPLLSNHVSFPSASSCLSMTLVSLLILSSPQEAERFPVKYCTELSNVSSQACYLSMKFWSWFMVYFRSVFLLSLQRVHPGIFKQGSLLNVQFLKNIGSSYHTL